MKFVIILAFSLSLGSSWARIDNIFNEHTSIEKPFELRDPFQAPKFKSESSKKRVQRASGILNNKPKLEQRFDLSKIKITGILIGKERRIFVNTGGNEVFTLREGDQFGLDGPEIKAILPGGVILVEKISNIYGEDEFIETVVPISQ